MTPYTSDELGGLIRSVADNLIDAGIHYRLFRDLAEAVTERPYFINEARAFWTLTLVAHRDAALFRLCRVFDQEPRAVGFRTLLSAIEENLVLFKEEPFRARLRNNEYVDELARANRVPSVAQLKADMIATGSKDELVKRLVTLRNNVFAHTSHEYALNPVGLHSAVVLEEGDIWALIERGLEIVNRYASLFVAQTYAREIIGRDDYQSVLGSLRRDYSARVAKLRSEMNNAGDWDEHSLFPPAT